MIGPQSVGHELTTQAVAVGGGILASAVVRDLYDGRVAAAKLSLIASAMAVAPMLAPMVGAWLVDAFNWRLPFAATALAGLLILLGIYTSLDETLAVRQTQHVLRQLLESLREFFSHRQCRFGVLVIMLTIVGIMALISGSSALVIVIYGYPVRYFGLIFALTGLAILAGSTINRRLLQRFDAMQMIGAGAALAGLAGAISLSD